MTDSTDPVNDTVCSAYRPAGEEISCDEEVNAISSGSPARQSEKHAVRPYNVLALRRLRDGGGLQRATEPADG